MNIFHDRQLSLEGQTPFQCSIFCSSCSSFESLSLSLYRISTQKLIISLSPSYNRLQLKRRIATVKKTLSFQVEVMSYSASSAEIFPPFENEKKTPNKKEKGRKKIVDVVRRQRRRSFRFCTVTAKGSTAC